MPNADAVTVSNSEKNPGQPTQQTHRHQDRQTYQTKRLRSQEPVTIHVIKSFINPLCLFPVRGGPFDTWGGAMVFTS